MNGFQAYVSSLHKVSQSIATLYYAIFSTFEIMKFTLTESCWNNFVITKTKFLWRESGYSVQWLCKTTEFFFFHTAFCRKFYVYICCLKSKTQKLKTALDSSAVQKQPLWVCFPAIKPARKITWWGWPAVKLSLKDVNTFEVKVKVSQLSCPTFVNC